ncbi:hypothetical protein BPA_0900010 [Borrelia parkeri SLO]|uniref:Uncharacterized protein n=1 Tax=Borrelia parkeri SLO TaxID=1313294 RepID=A0ABN4C6T6_BORPR|nr:hypothetical protein BPA_0900010 [Borrelia parkeri SLO]
MSFIINEVVKSIEGELKIKSIAFFNENFTLDR